MKRREDNRIIKTRKNVAGETKGEGCARFR